jgi:hypothetical protein
MRNAVSLALWLGTSGLAQAQAVCSAPYKVQKGDSFFTLAEQVYGTYEKWALIY